MDAAQPAHQNAAQGLCRPSHPIQPAKRRSTARPFGLRRPPNRSSRGLQLSFALLFAIGVSSRAHAGPTTPTVAVKVLQQYPHDAAAFTQGFELDPDNPSQYIESTGHYGRSTLRRVELNTGKIIQRFSLERQFFAEGLTRIGNTLVQLTWKAGQALRYDARNFSPAAPWTYQGEGWGICFDGKALWMSDGSSTLTARNPTDFTVLRSVTVRYNGQALSQLNELECARGHVYANVWHQDWVAEIDTQSGNVTRRIDASALRSQAGPYAGTLNGIAYRSKTGTFLLTGKNWSKIFEVGIALNADSSANSDTSKPGPAKKVGPTKSRGCALLSGRNSSAFGFLISLGLVFGGSNLRRRKTSTAKCALADHA